jgi:uncharacterized protein YkwD
MRNSDGRRSLLLLALTAILAGAGTDAATASIAFPAGQEADAVLRVLNAARSRRGVAPLASDRRLADAARRHSRDMVAHHYFSHDSRSGARFSARIARTGWMRGRRHWKVGETLAWGSAGRSAAPRSVVAAWLHSPAHRHVVLGREYRVVGIGIARGTPGSRRAGGRTLTADFGS